MKKFLLLFITLFLCGSCAFADTYVNGYYRSNGTYVQPHYRTTADSNPYNNYSTKGNYNPYTGEKGYVNPNNIQQNYSNRNYGNNNNTQQPQNNYYGY